MEHADCLVVMGVAGSGKTTVGRELAGRLGREFLDADTLHSAPSVAKMRRGVPLTDEDRADWLLRVRDWIRQQSEAGTSTVVACSALRRRYRDQLRSVGAPICFCQLDVPVEQLAVRLARRRGHFLPPSLLPSQLATLEPLAADEPGFKVDGAGTPEAVIGRLLGALARHPA